MSESGEASGKALKQLPIAYSKVDGMVTGHVAVKRRAFILSAVSKVLASMHGASGCQRHKRRVPTTSPRPSCVHYTVDSAVFVQPLTLELLHTQPQCKG
jgi:hypothetical protein